MKAVKITVAGCALGCFLMGIHSAPISVSAKWVFAGCAFATVAWLLTLITLGSES